MLGAKNKDYRGFYVNFCINCINHWTNNQGWPKYLKPQEIAEMLEGGATPRYVLCPDCKKEVHRVTQNTKHSTR